jgi:hypothetical protein
MGMMTGSGECWSGDCDHEHHLTSDEKIKQLERLLKQAMYNDPSTFVNGKPWHKEVKETLRSKT